MAAKKRTRKVKCSPCEKARRQWCKRWQAIHKSSKRNGAESLERESIAKGRMAHCGWAAKAKMPRRKKAKR